MSESPQSSTPEPQPNDPLIDLRSPGAETRRTAALSLAHQPALSAPALNALEHVAATDTDPAVRQAALTALESPAARRMHAARTMPLSVRMEMLEQIEHWRVAGLLTSSQASAVRLRYTFDLAPRGLSPAAFNGLAGQVDVWQQAGLIAPEQVAGLRASLEQAIQSGGAARIPPAAQAAPAARETAAPPAPVEQMEAAPRQSLQQVLFSEVSIRIALYLGGFLIVAAALILAAVLEFARLPILLGLTALTGAGAFLTRTRLPLPSFVLFIIFASLLPIDAGVAADQLKLRASNPRNTYWAVMMTIEALVLAWGTLRYRSRLLSLGALASLNIAAIYLAARLGDRIEYYLLLLTLASLVSAAWQVLLKQLRPIWPVHWLTHLQILPLFALNAFTTLLYMAFTYDSSIGETVEPEHRLLLGATWLVIIAFYVLNDVRVKRFFLLPYLAGAAAVFAPWILFSALPVSAPWVAAGVALTGAAAALAGNRLAFSATDEQPMRRYASPLLMASAGLLLWAAVVGWITELAAAFAILLAAGGLYSALHAQKPRPVLWLTALAAFLAAYFTFFHLPFARGWEIDFAYQAAGAGLLLIFPSLLPLRGAQVEIHWLTPARIVGFIITGLTTLALMASYGTAAVFGDLVWETGPVTWHIPAWIFSVTAIFFLLFTLRRKTHSTGYAVTGYLFAALTCWLLYFDQTRLMLPLSALAAGFYLSGLVLLLTGNDPRWASVLRYSGLFLGAVLLLFLPAELEDKLGPGLALLLAGALFLSEVHIRRGGWLELPMYVLLITAATRLLRLLASGDALPGYDLLVAALIVLGFDLYFTRQSWPQTAAIQVQRLALRVLGGVLVAACALFWVLSEEIQSRQPAITFLLLAGFFLFLAWGYRQPRLGYLTFAFLAGSLFYWMRVWGYETWLAPEIALAAALYAGSFVFRRMASGRNWTNSPVWFEVLRLSGLGLAMLVSLSAPLEGSGLAASLWVAIAASLYAVEAFRLRNVWLGFPANGLYLLAYFILLFELKVREPQYFSVGVAVLGILMHYLLVRSGSRWGAFITGLVSQFVLLGTTYIQMVSTNRLSFFVMLFFQGLAVLAYGIIIRSRSLVLAPVVFIVVGVITVVLSVLSGIPSALIIGCTGVILLGLGILALVMRERLVEVSERFGGWRA